MKNIYVILAFHAHELLWDLPERLLSYLEENNPMKKTLLDENYLKKRKDEGRDIYSLCSKFGDSLQAPLCVEFTNELLVQLEQVMPEAFARLVDDYQRGRYYPLYGHAHHTHVSLLRPEEITQEILWNKTYLHQHMGVPYPRYQGLFPPEASFSYEKMEALGRANIAYVIFPHLNLLKAPFQVDRAGDYTHKPFFIRAGEREILAFPRNFPISQEIWRPITKMKRDEVKPQGYLLGEYPVLTNEYLYGEKENFPISFEEGVEIYKRFLRQELEKAPDRGVLVYIQDLELMDFGDDALSIMEKAWQDILQQDAGDYRLYFITPDDYLDKVISQEELKNLPRVSFQEICWAPEIRPVLRTDGHYPPLGVTGVGRYDLQKTGLFSHPHVFWENGKYYCGIFDALLDNFQISGEVPVSAERLGASGYRLASESLETQAILYLRLMKRACNWGWRPTEGRQKRPCLKGYLLCSLLLQRLEQNLTGIKQNYQRIDDRNFVGLAEILKVFISSRVNYLRYGLRALEEEKGIDLSSSYALFEQVDKWKNEALQNVKKLYELNRRCPQEIRLFLIALQGYSQAVYMATDYIQRVWGESDHPEYLVGKMYHYLYDLYPPLLPEMITKIDHMTPEEIEDYFREQAFSEAVLV